jgi:hypothetical protein
MTKSRLASALLAVPMATVAGVLALSAQELVTAGSEEFDRNRAMLFDSTIYAPFHVTDESRPLRDALSDGTLQDQTVLLVIQNPEGKLALVRDQMSYHHVAQGEIRGEPWMVSF